MTRYTNLERKKHEEAVGFEGFNVTPLNPELKRKSSIEDGFTENEPSPQSLQDMNGEPRNATILGGIRQQNKAAGRRKLRRMKERQQKMVRALDLWIKKYL